MGVEGKIPEDQDYYKTLGVAKTATESEIKAAYKKLAIKYHPDKNPDNKELAEENFKKVSEAYEVLSNPEKRKMFDQFGKQGLEGAGGMPGGFGQADAERVFSQFFGGQDPFSVLFGEMGGGGRGGMPGGMSFQFQQMGGMPDMRGGGGGGGMGGLPPGFAQMMGGMGGMPGMMGGMGGMPGMGGMGGMPGMGGMGGSSRKRRPREQPHTIPAGASVLVRGLVGAAHHNGKRGKVEDYDEGSKRYTVGLAEGDSLSIKHDNLLQLVDAEVTGMQSRPELNGTFAAVLDYDAAKGRYHAQLQRGKSMAAMQPCNLIMPVGTRVTVTGLVGGAQWNGHVGKVLSFDREAGRYSVQLSAEQQLRVKLENVIL